MAQFDLKNQLWSVSAVFCRSARTMKSRGKLAMLIEGECEGWDPSKPPGSSGFSSNATFQLRAAFDELGAQALQSQRAAQRPITVERLRCSTGDPGTAFLDSEHRPKSSLRNSLKADGNQQSVASSG